ncbi:unnamed protein product [Prorocentrum cordatum]|uniref:Nocturnin n=1 Tax=Prorocentrum cordatum TaxID=2364126 RepID=A0ABN9XL49_9DINO|nr:unnamed protein product [Polarella glacialis]
MGRATRPAVYDLVSRLVSATPQHVTQHESTRALLADIQRYLKPMLAAIRGGPYGGDNIAATIAQLHMCKARSDMLAKQVLSVVRSANARSWKEWVDNALDKGAKAARKFIKERTKWEPDTVVIKGKLTASIQSTLDTYRAKFGKFWDPAAAPLRRDNDLREPIGIPATDALRDLSESYGKASAVSLDGFHMRHLSMLSEEALELDRHGCDVVGLCEVDRYEDYFEPAMAARGYSSAYKRKRSPARDGVAVFWRRDLLEEALHRHVFLERGSRRTRGMQVALLQRLRLNPGSGATAGSCRSVVVCAVHLRASADDAYRMQQASLAVEALADFGRGDAQEGRIVLADVNSQAPPGTAAAGGSARASMSTGLNSDLA